jgi:hypothetical protein
LTECQSTKIIKNGMKLLIHHNTISILRYSQIIGLLSYLRRSIAPILLLFVGLSLHAQAPQAFNYQAVCRDTNGTPLAQQLVTYRASVLQGSPSGIVVYRETHTDTTNVYGISTLQIGRGTPIQGTFASIPWKSGSYYLRIEMDPAGGSNYRNLGAPELLSVPYALQSKDGIAKGTITNQLLFWNGTAWDTLNPGSSGQMLTMCNGNLIWGNCPGSITGLSCSTAVNSGQLVEGLTATLVSARLAYTGGNGGLYAAQTIASTGVTGLTANISGGYFVNGNDSVTVIISGTPFGNGGASFSFVLGGQSCTLTRIVVDPWRPGMVHCSAPTQIVPVTNPITNKTWMDRNLGASQVATSSTDANAYGDLYQWGRYGDGHQCRNSVTTTILSSTDTPGNANFIITSGVSNYDWRNPRNDSLWQGLNGTNIPCPFGYRLPTETELNEERQSWTVNGAAGAFLSPLKLTLGAYRHLNGVLAYLDIQGFYWSSSISLGNPRNLNFDNSNAVLPLANRGSAMSIRCIQD